MGADDSGLPADALFSERFKQRLAMAAALACGRPVDVEFAGGERLFGYPDGSGRLFGRQTKPRMEDRLRWHGCVEGSPASRGLGFIIHRTASHLARRGFSGGSRRQASKVGEPNTSDFCRVGQTAKRTKMSGGFAGAARKERLRLLALCVPPTAP